MSSDQNRLKQDAAESAAALVSDSMVVGLGTGSTAAFALQALGRRVREGLRITGIPTSEKTAAMARELGIPLTDFAQNARVDVTIDGADEVESATLNLIKGHGGALLREKIVACASRRVLIIADETKLVDHLGEHMSLPVEVVPFGWESTARALAELGLEAALRTTASGEPFLSDGSHYILDCAIPAGRTPQQLAADLDGIVGVVEHGLFLGIASEVHLASPGGVRVLRQNPRA